MKFQLVIIAALFISAYALPVPDEEVSPGVQAAPQIKEKNAELLKNDEKIIDAIKPAEPRVAETPAAEPKKEEKLAAELPLNAPDAELPQRLPAEKKEEKKDKQTRAEDKVVEEAKALPVSGAAASAVLPAGAAGIAEEPKHAEEAQPLSAAAAVEEQASIEGKSTIIAEAAPAEQKKDELSAAEETPILKTEGKPAGELSADAAPAALTPVATETLKKDETPARQERVGEAVNEVDAKGGHVAPVVGGVVAGAVVPAAVSGGADVVVPAVKSLPAEESVPVAPAASAPFVEATKEHLKSSAIPEHQAPAKAEALAQAPAGDISQQASEESGATKALKSDDTSAAPEAKQIEVLSAAPAPAVAPAAAALSELPKAEQKEIDPIRKESEAAKILEEKKSAVEPAIKKPSAAKGTDSSDSSESKESNESNEDKSN